MDGEPGGLQSTGLQKSGLQRSTHTTQDRQGPPVPKACGQPRSCTGQPLHLACPCWLRAPVFGLAPVLHPRLQAVSLQPTNPEPRSEFLNSRSRTLPPCLSFPSCHPGCRPGNALFTHGCFRRLQVTCLLQSRNEVWPQEESRDSECASA